MIGGNKVYHEWMVGYVNKIQSMKTANEQELLQILDKANQYKYRLVEVLGESEFKRQLLLYVEKHDRLGFLV